MTNGNGVAPIAWYKSPTIRALTGYAALLIFTWFSHRPWGKQLLAYTGIDEEAIHGVLDQVVSVAGLALAGWLAKKRVDAGASPTPPAPIVGSQKTVDRITGGVPKPGPQPPAE